MARSTLTPTGILVPDPRITTSTISPTDSTFQQAGPKGAGPRIMPTSGATVTLEGEQAASVVLTTTRGGAPLPANGARLKWRPATGSHDYGWSPPTWHDYSTASTVLDETDVCDAIQLQSGALLAAVGRGTAGNARCARWTPTTDTWAAGGILPYVPTDASPTDGMLVLRQHSDGTVYAIISDRDAPTLRCLLVKSTDDGDNWTTVAQCAFVGGSPVFGRAGRWWLTGAGTHILVLLDSDAIQTWSSTDGLQWVLVGSITGVYSASNGWPAADVQMTASGQLLYAYAADTDTDATICRVCHPTQDPSTTAVISVYAPGAGAITDVCLLPTESGRVYVWIYRPGYYTNARWSDDYGQTWAGTGYVYQDGDNSQGMLRRAVQLNGGHAVIRADWTSSTVADQAYVYVVGGWQTWEPYAVAANTSTDDGGRLTWGGPLSPAEWPGRTHTPGFALGTGWTTVNSGTPTVSTGVARSISTTSGELEYYTYVQSLGRSAVAFLDVACSSGGTTSGLRAGWKIQTRLAGSTRCKIECRISTTQFRLADSAGATLVTVTRDMSALRTQFMVCMETGNRLEVYYRTPGAQEWTSAYQTASPVTGSLSDHFYLQWGNITAAGGGETTTSTWRFVGVTRYGGSSSSTAKDDQWRCVQSTDTARQPILGRPLSAYPASLGSPATLPLVSAQDVLSLGESLTVAPRYTHPIDSIDPRKSPSPRRKWRSTDTSEQFIGWELDATYDAELRCLGLFISGANFRTCTLQYWNGAAWVDYVDLDLRWGGAAYSMTLVRSGSTVTTSTGSLDWLQHAEAAGGSVEFASGDVRRISRNDAGQGSTSFRLTITGVDGTETATGTGYLRMPQGFALGYPAADMRRIRLKIDSQTTAEGYFEAGTIAVGQVYAFGLPQDWGTVETSTPDVRTYELPGYQVRARRAPPARRWGVQWPMASLSVLRSDSDADHFTPDGNTAVRFGLVDDVYQLIRGLVEEEADTVPVLVLPALQTADTSAGDDWSNTEVRRDVLWWGSVEGAATSELITGDVGSSSDSELLRVGSLTLQEIV